MIDVRHDRARCDVHDIVKPREHRLGHERGVVDGDPAEGVPKQTFDAQPNSRRVAITGQVDNAGDESSIVVDSQVELRLATLKQVHDRRGDLDELLGVCLQ